MGLPAARLLVPLALAAALAAGCQPKSAVLLDQAEERWLMSDYREAVKLFLQVVDRYPGTPEAETALMRTGETYMLNLSEPQKALEHFRRVAIEYPKGPYAVSAMEAMAMIHEKLLKDYESAVIQYQMLIDLTPAPGKHDEYQMAIARCFYDKGDYQQSLVEYQTVLSDYPASKLAVEAELQIANAYFVMNKCDLAVTQYRKLLEDHPDSAYKHDILLSIGMCMEEKEEYADALQIYEDLLGKYRSREIIQKRMDFVLSRMKMKNR